MKTFTFRGTVYFHDQRSGLKKSIETVLTLDAQNKKTALAIVRNYGLDSLKIETEARRRTRDEAAKKELNRRAQNGMLVSTLSKGPVKITKPEIEAIVMRWSRGESTQGLVVSDSGRLRSCLRRANWPEDVINFLIYRSAK